MKSKKYKYIIFDADDTLVDYVLDSERAFQAALVAAGCAGDEEVLRTWVEFDFGNWDKLGLSDLSTPAMQARYHALYRTHVRDIFAQTPHLDGIAAEKAFLEEFAKPGIEIEGAAEVVAELKARGYRVYAATNGLASLQRTRLSAFPLDGIFISEEMDTVKPNPAYFEHIFAHLGAKKEECLMVGDTLSTDIACARAVGVDCIWLNRRGKPCPNGVREIHNLKELLEIL